MREVDDNQEIKMLWPNAVSMPASLIKYCLGNIYCMLKIVTASLIDTHSMVTKDFMGMRLDSGSAF